MSGMSVGTSVWLSGHARHDQARAARLDPAAGPLPRLFRGGHRGLRVEKSSLRLERLFLWLGGKYSQRKISKVLFDLQCNFLEIATKTCCAIFSYFTIFALNIFVFLQIYYCCFGTALIIIFPNNQSSPSGVTKQKNSSKGCFVHFGHFARRTVILDRADASRCGGSLF